MASRYHLSAMQHATPMSTGGVIIGGGGGGLVASGLHIHPKAKSNDMMMGVYQIGGT
jgi:hypothetical protein